MLALMGCAMEYDLSEVPADGVHVRPIWVLPKHIAAPQCFLASQMLPGWQ
jgi:hypothetical protein